MRRSAVYCCVALPWFLMVTLGAPAHAKPGDEQLNPKAVEQYKRGAALAEQGDHAGALAAYEEAIRIEPQWLAAHNDLGVELYLTGEPKRAVEQYRTALAIDAAQGAVHANLAFALYDLGQVDDAVGEWRTALARGAQVADTYAGLALGLFKQGKTEEALRTYRTAIDRDKSYAHLDHLGANGAGWSRHAVEDAASLLHALQKPTPAGRSGAPS